MVHVFALSEAAKPARSHSTHLKVYRDCFAARPARRFINLNVCSKEWVSKNWR